MPLNKEGKPDKNNEQYYDIFCSFLKLVSFFSHWWNFFQSDSDVGGCSYPSVEMQSVYSIAPADRAIRLIGEDSQKRWCPRKHNK